MNHAHGEPASATTRPRAGATATPARPPVVPYVGGLLALQRLAGNAAIGTLLRAPVQRWVGTEHMELGDSSHPPDIDIGNGVTLTWGQVVAIAGDEYPDVETLRKDTETDEGRRRIRAALEHAGVLDARSIAALPEPSADEKAAHEKDYVNLLLTNIEHFAEGGAVDRWRTAHTQALAGALAAGVALRPGDLAAAQTTEAFGQHFLTDAFSGGHVRTPRKEIIDWYVGFFAPLVVDHFLNQLKDRLVSEFTMELYLQMGGMFSAGLVHEKVQQKADEKLAEALAKIGGHDVLVRYFGLAVAGSVSGALHDLEGERGVWVASKAHPDVFQAFGDNLLDDPRNATNRAQAVLAVAAARDDLNRAYSIGEAEAAASDTTPADLLGIVYFGFDSSTLRPADSILLQRAGAYLARHPETKVDVVGHTDPIGKPAYNDALGQHRADAVAGVLMASGASMAQVKPSSAGESQLVTEDPRQFNLDRRASLVWRTEPEAAAPDPDGPLARAQKALQAAVGPPYQKVDDLIPRPVEEMGITSNVPLEEWRWGTMASNLATRLDKWANEHVGPSVGKLLDNVPEEEFIDTGGVNVGGKQLSVHPRAAVQKIVADLLSSATTFLGYAFGATATGK